MKDRIIQIVSKVSGKNTTIFEAATDTEKLWTSLNHFEIVLALEEEFNIHLSTEEIMEMTSINAIEALIARKVS